MQRPALSALGSIGADGADHRRIPTFPRWSLRRRLIDTKDVIRVPDAPSFTYPIYAAYGADRRDTELQTALRGLRWLAASVTE